MKAGQFEDQSVSIEEVAYLCSHFLISNFFLAKETLTQKASGIASTVYQARLKNSTSLVAIKTASSLKRFSPEPHDILKEIAIISSISHANARPLLQILCKLI